MRWPFRVVLLLQAVCTAFLQRPVNIAVGLPTKFKRYDDQIVFRIPTDSSEEHRSIYNAATELSVDVWLQTHAYIDLAMSFEVSRSFFSRLPANLRKRATQMIPDLSHAIQRNIPSDFTSNFLNERIPSINDTFFSDYQTVEAIDAWMTLVVAMHPSLVSIINLGMTHEGREIRGLRVSRPLSLLERMGVTKRKIILVHGAQHAREWISISTVCYLAYSIVAGQSTDQDIKKMADDYDWVFVPTLNIDGYAYSFQDRLWRKNRQPTTVPFCKGIDLDRNWGYGWDSGQGFEGLISNPCSENFQGAAPFEANETRALSRYIEEIAASTSYKLTGYLDLHSYAQTILYPYSLSCDIDVRDEESLLELGVGASRAMRAASGEHYDTESACNQDGHILANLNSGAALDWVYHSGVPWSYVVKLRDTGSYGFLVPKEEIVPTGEEMLQFIKYYATFISEHAR